MLSPEAAWLQKNEAMHEAGKSIGMVSLHCCLKAVGFTDSFFKGRLEGSGSRVHQCHSRILLALTLKPYSHRPSPESPELGFLEGPLWTLKSPQLIQGLRREGALYALLDF